MLRRTAVDLLSRNPLTRRALEWMRATYIAHRQNRFYTCSPDAVPVVERALELTRDLEGDYYEFGLFKGFLFHRAYTTAKKMGLDSMRFFGFDSFAGLPTPEGIDAGWRFQQGMYACDYERVELELRRRGVAIGKDAYLIKGFYADTLANRNRLDRFPFGRARVVTIDCDLYSSTRDVLAFIDPYLQDGCVLLMDDWNCFDEDDHRGQRRAMREFLGARPRVEMERLGGFGWHGVYFRVHIRGEGHGPSGQETRLTP